MAAATAILEYSSSKPTPAVLCPNCGSYCPVASGAASGLGDENQRRIAELEAQVSLLKKTAADADRSSPSQSPPRPSTAPGDRTYPPATAHLPAPPATPATSTSRFGALLLGTSATTSPQSSATTPANPTSSLLRKLSGSGSGSATHSATLSAGSAAELAARLAREQDLRQRAEGQAAQMSSELEELSASLFAQANEMVAAERRARAKLEERVVVLERRDGEKRVRLERLERALGRIERVKGVLGQTGAVG